jgi:hypothetical protein
VPRAIDPKERQARILIWYLARALRSLSSESAIPKGWIRLAKKALKEPPGSRLRHILTVGWSEVPNTADALGYLNRPRQKKRKSGLPRGRPKKIFPDVQARLLEIVQQRQATMQAANPAQSVTVKAALQSLMREAEPKMRMTELRREADYWARRVSQAKPKKLRRQKKSGKR